ncbi:unnamed protein product [Closterium sp. NIES-53]
MSVETRSRAYEVFRLWLAHVQRQSGEKLNIWQSDGAAEFRSKELQDYLVQKGIEHHISLPYAHQQQGVAERTNRTLMTKVRALMKQSKLPPTYWTYAMHHAVRAAALGASASTAALGASESAGPLGASESAAALGARASPATGPSSADALHTYTLYSGASRCFFRDCTTLTPLPAPVPVSLADPTGGPVVARASTVLPCPAVPSGSLSSLHFPTFSTNLVSNAAIQDVWINTFIPRGQRVAICMCSRTGCHLATFTRRLGSSLYTLTTASPQVAEAGQVAASSQVSASGQLAASCLC